MARIPQSSDHPLGWRETQDTFGEFDFDVTCVLGSVHVQPGEGPSPHVAAFSMIAEHDVPGTYSFPMSNGQTCVVSYSYEDDPR
jgi:hypothetical protein